MQKLIKRPPATEVFESYTVQYNLNNCAAVGNVTMTIVAGIVKVGVCCGDALVSGECLITKEEVWRFLR